MRKPVLAALAAFALVAIFAAAPAAAAKKSYCSAADHKIGNAGNGTLGYAVSTLKVDQPGKVKHVSVGISIKHTYVGDLTVIVYAPRGNGVVLTNEEGGSGEDFGIGTSCSAQFTRFDDGASTNISDVDSADAPFVGAYSPDDSIEENALSNLEGRKASGRWRIAVFDMGADDRGKVRAVKLTVRSR